MPKVRKIPLRMCVGCREMKTKAELMRVVKAPDGQLSLDPVGKKPGRGAYVCVNAACLAKARKQRSLARALETQITEDVYDQLEARLEAMCDKI
ncbi:MAG: YlxR family protein [Clostridia bacterium]